MDITSLFINISALTLSLVATIVSTIFARRQVRMAEHSNLANVTELLSEFQTPEFRLHRDYVTTRLWSECPSEEAGFTNLPDEPRRHVYAVANFFNTVGKLAANGMVSSLAISSYMGRSILRTWTSLEPYIRYERRTRPDENYMAFFEHIVCLVRETPPSVIKRRLRLRRLPADAQTTTISPIAGQAESDT